MTQMQFTDTATLKGTRKDADGNLIAEAFAVRTGIQIYRGSEIGLADRDVLRVYRPEDEVRDPASLATFSHAPITLGHPDRVTPENWQDLAKGEVSTEAVWEGNKIKLPLIIKAADAIAAVENGTRELSAGYICDLEFSDGVTPDGEPYDAIQRDIRVNHLAIVPKGRAGSECRIGDGADQWGASPLTDADTKETSMNLRKILVDGLQVETTDAGAQAIEKLQSQLSAKDADHQKAIANKDSEHSEAIAAKDKEIATKDAKIDDLEGKVLSDADLDKRVTERAALVADAAKVDDKVKTDGLADADIRKAVVSAKLGDEAIADRSDAYIEARFDALVEAADAKKPDQFADTVKAGGTTTQTTDLDQAYADRNSALQDAWKGETSKEA